MLIVVYYIPEAKPFQAYEMELLPKVVTGYRGKFRILPNI